MSSENPGNSCEACYVVDSQRRGVEGWEQEASGLPACLPAGFVLSHCSQIFI
jgi:hypothetical protein